MPDPVVKVSPFELPADSEAVRVLAEWKAAGGLFKDLFRLALEAYGRSGAFQKRIQELRSIKEVFR